jgi:DNA polymerase-3 subunit delta
MLRLYVGDDLVQMEEALGELLSQLGPSAAQGAVVRFEGASADLDELAMACQSAPFLGSTRVVVVRELGGRLLALDEAAKRALLGALGSLAPTTELVIVEPDWTDDPRAHPLWELASAKGEAKVFSLERGRDAVAWVLRRFAREGVSADPNVAVELLTRVGEEPLQLQSEIQKLVTHSLPSKKVSLSDVQALVPRSVQGNVFALVEALGGKEAARALKLAEELSQTEGEGAGGVLAFLGRHFRNLLAVKEMLAERKRFQDLERQLDVPSWQVRRLAAQSTRFSLAELERSLALTVQADLRAKATDADLPQILVELVAQILSPEQDPV